MEYCQEALPKENVNLLRDIRLCMKKTFSAVGCERKWREGGKVDMERLDEEAKQEEGKSGKGEVEGEKERVEKKNRCLEHLPSIVFGEHCFVPEVERLEMSLGLPL